MSDADPRCPECGEPIGRTATYCMHCSADLTDELGAADADDDWTWDQAEGSSGAETASEAEATSEAGTASGAEATSEPSSPATESAAIDDQSDTIVTGVPWSQREDRPASDSTLLDPDGIADATLTSIVGIVGGFVVGSIGTIALVLLTGSGWAIPIGFAVWLASTAYLVRRETVQAAISQAGYAGAVVLLLVPLVAFSPAVTVDGGIAERGGLFVILLAFVIVPAAVAGAVGWFAGRFVPGDGGESGE